MTQTRFQEITDLAYAHRGEPLAEALIEMLDVYMQVYIRAKAKEE